MALLYHFTDSTSCKGCLSYGLEVHGTAADSLRDRHKFQVVAVTEAKSVSNADVIVEYLDPNPETLIL